MTKIDIISGFLGAGKTTFIKKLLEEAIAGEQVVLIENEFGEIGIDGGFLKDSGIEIREMNSGCICCSLVGDFGTSLAEVLTQYKPERIIKAAVKGMLPKNRLSKVQLDRLRIFRGAEHPHTPQQPQVFEIAQVSQQAK